MTDDEVENYVLYLWERLPPAQAHVTPAQVRAVLDAESAYFERRFGSIHSVGALLRSIFGRGEPAPAAVEQALPQFEEHVVTALAASGDLTRDDIRAVMRVEGEAGPRWSPPVPRAPDADGAAVAAEDVSP